MTTNAALQCLDGNLTTNGLVIPSDYVRMKNGFKQELIRFYLADLTYDQKILDLNPGLHGIYHELRGSSVEYVGLEQNPRIREVLEERNVQVRDWKIPQIPLGDESVDCVLSAPFIEHLPTYVDALNLLLEVKRILKPGGRLVMIVPNYLSLKEIFFEDYKHGWITTRKRMEDMLADCQYEVLGFRYTIGWITMRMNPVVGMFRIGISMLMGLLRVHLVDRLLEVLTLNRLSTKFKKTFFELIVIEARIKDKWEGK